MEYSLFPHSLSTENSKNSRRRKAVRNPLGTRMKRRCLDCVFCSPMHRCVESERERVPMDLLQPSAPCYSFCYSFYYPFCYSSLFFLLFFPLSFLLSFPLFPIISHYFPLFPIISLSTRMNRHIAKPIDMNELFQTIYLILRERSSTETK